MKDLSINCFEKPDTDCFFEFRDYASTKHVHRKISGIIELQIVDQVTSADTRMFWYMEQISETAS
jgi:hypothetical protein